MSNIVCDCAAELNMVFLQKKGITIFLMDSRGTFSSFGESPTLEELENGKNKTGLNRLLAIDVKDFQNIEHSHKEETGADTADGLTNEFDHIYKISGNFRIDDNSLRNDLLSYECCQRLQIWIVKPTREVVGGNKGINVFRKTFYGLRDKVQVSFNFFYREY